MYLLNDEIPEDLEKAVYSGTIGEQAGSMFCSHLPIFRTNMNLMDIVINKGDCKFPTRDKIADRWALTFGVASMANEDTIERIIEIANILYTDYHENEYAKVVVSQASTSYPEVASSSIWLDFIKSPLGISLEK